MFNHETKSINGSPGPIGVESVTALIRTEKKQQSHVRIFCWSGPHSNSQLFKDQLDMDENGYLIIGQTSKTAIPGVFARWRRSPIILYRQAVTSAGTGYEANWAA